MRVELAGKLATVETELMVWMAVHGHLQLALRHPENEGPSAEWIRQFVKEIGEMLVREGILSQAELDFANYVEQTEQMRRM